MTHSKCLRAAGAGLDDSAQLGAEAGAPLRRLVRDVVARDADAQEVPGGVVAARPFALDVVGMERSGEGADAPGRFAACPRAAPKQGGLVNDSHTGSAGESMKS